MITANSFGRPPRWWLAMLVLLIALLTSCRSAQLPISTDLPPQTSTTHIEYRDRLMHDTTYVHDSIFIRDKGDTVYVTRWRDKYTERIQVDTCYTQRTDTIKLVKSVYVKQPLSRWEQTELTIGRFTLWFILVVAIVFCAQVAWKLYRRQ